MKVFFLFPYPLDESPSQRFRFEQYFSALKTKGIRFETQSFWNEPAWKLLYDRGRISVKFFYFLYGIARRLWVLPKLQGCSFVFIHRECAPLGPPVLEWIIARILKRKIIYDFDDSIWLPNTSAENKIVSLLKWHGKVSAICRWSHRVSCGNAYLADHASNYNASVIINPTTIDTQHLHNPELHPGMDDSSPTVIGWTGSRSTLPYLKPVLPVIESLSKRYPDLKFLIIADQRPDWNLSSLEFKPWNKQTEIADLMRINIGIMPLTDDSWANGKCGFKALQYMSLEIPALVSPVGVNTLIVDHGINGFHCATADDWERKIEYLIQRREECQKMGRAGRDKVVHHYSVLSNTANFLALFE